MENNGNKFRLNMIENGWGMTNKMPSHGRRKIRQPPPGLMSLQTESKSRVTHWKGREKNKFYNLTIASIRMFQTKHDKNFPHPYDVILYKSTELFIAVQCKRYRIKPLN